MLNTLNSIREESSTVEVENDLFVQSLADSIHSDFDNALRAIDELLNPEGRSVDTSEAYEEEFSFNLAA